MGKKKSKGEYNDFLDGEKLHDNTEIRTTLQGFAARDISPPPARQSLTKDHKKGKGGAKKPPLTHFLCLPLVTDTSRPQLQQGLEKFKEELAKDGPVPTKAVRPVGTLHLTLGVMSLNARELEEAKQYLQDLDLHILLRDITHRCIAEKAAEDGEIAENLNAAAMPDTDALTVNLESLVPMQAPHKTSILYAEPRDVSQRLEPFALTLREQFAEKGFLVEDTRPLRLHATIMNTIYAKPKRGRGARTKSARLRDGLKYVEHKVSPHHHDGEDGVHNEDGTSTAGSVDGETTAPPDPSTAEEGNDGAAGEGHGPDGKSWMRFDARNMIDNYKDFVWAENVRVDKVYICKMGATKIWSGTHEGDGEVLDEQYEVVASKAIFD
ncbi:AKAP7-NLS domain containing protein [Pyrenophora teres f. maculata]|nr:AKAP7-NLS domain containing protein [Pyrenophora teres f. maculata]